MNLHPKIERTITFLPPGKWPNPPIAYWSTKPYHERLVEVFAIVSASKEKHMELIDDILEREVTELEGVAIPFLSRKHFIQNKLAIGRPQDLADVDHLRRMS